MVIPFKVGDNVISRSKREWHTGKTGVVVRGDEGFVTVWFSDHGGRGHDGGLGGPKRSGYWNFYKGGCFVGPGELMSELELADGPW